MYAYVPSSMGRQQRGESIMAHSSLFFTVLVVPQSLM
jgi:hypothetical protein